MPEVKFERMSDTKDMFTVDSIAIPELVMDFSAVSDDERNQDHTGARYLCVAALACFANTFRNSLNRNGAQIVSMSGSANTIKEKDSSLRTRYTTLEITMEVGMEEKYREIYEQVEANMMLGSLLTYSLEAGMEVEYNLSMVATD